MDYWQECVSEAFDEACIIATSEQIATVADCVQGSHENYGMAHGHDAILNPLQTENDNIKKKLKDENDKIHCETCNVRGRIVENLGLAHTSNSECHICRGEGRYLP